MYRVHITPSQIAHEENQKKNAMQNRSFRLNKHSSTRISMRSFWCVYFSKDTFEYTLFLILPTSCQNKNVYRMSEYIFNSIAIKKKRKIPLESCASQLKVRRINVYVWKVCDMLLDVWFGSSGICIRILRQCNQCQYRYAGQ